jgi:hypothetical protein
MFNRRPQEPKEESESTGAEDAAKADAKSSKTLSLTEEELERRVQAETDRREAKRLADAKVRQRKELRKTDPWAYAEQDEQAEQAEQSEQQLTEFFSNIGREHDKVSIDPLFEVLPKEERERILGLDGAGKGLEGRRLVVTEAMKALEKHWRAEGAKDAESKLRRNPAFRKQVLAEGRGTTAEPELLPAGSASETDRTVSALLRKHYQLG